MKIGIKIYQAILVLLWVCVVIPADVSAAAKKEKKIKWVKSPTGVASLMTLSKDREDMVREYKRETARYEFLKKSIDEGRISKGMDAASVKKDFGEAVVVVPGEKEGTERWVYKSSSATYFKGPRIYLSFSEEKLSDWSVLD